eukprot:1443574-Prymnesium_polylepis.4
MPAAAADATVATYAASVVRPSSWSRGIMLEPRAKTAGARTEGGSDGGALSDGGRVVRRAREGPDRVCEISQYRICSRRRVAARAQGAHRARHSHAASS